MIVIDGKELATRRREELKAKTTEFSQQYGRPPGLAVVLVGEDPASQVYVRNKGKACEKVGFESELIQLPSDTSQKDLIGKVEDLNKDEKIDAYLVQLPLPEHLDEKAVTAHIAPEKDADGLTIENLGLLFAGRPRVAPCTPAGVIKMLEDYNISMARQNAVVVGRSQIVGLPMAHLLLQQQATVTVCHSRTKDMRAHLKSADIVVAAAGKEGLIGKDDIKSGAVVVDVGIHRKEKEGKRYLVGDVRYDELEGVASAATPVPGGVGPMTIQMLLENTFSLAEQAMAQK